MKSFDAKKETTNMHDVPPMEKLLIALLLTNLENTIWRHFSLVFFVWCAHIQRKENELCHLTYYEYFYEK